MWGTHKSFLPRTEVSYFLLTRSILFVTTLQVDISIKLWKNGFTVNDHFRSYSDGASQQFLNSIKKGELPLELEGTFDKEEVDVKVEDKKNEVCMSTKPVFQPFSGQGHRLGRWVGSCSVLSRSRGLTNIPTSLYYRVDDIRRAYHFSRWKWGFSY